MLLGEGQLCGERILARRSVQWLSQNHLSPRQAETLNRDSMVGYGYGGLMRTLLEPAQGFSLGVAGDGGQGEGGCDAFTCAVIIDSDEPEEKIARLTEVCRKACMAFETVAKAVPTSTTLVLNGESHTIGAGQ